MRRTFHLALLLYALAAVPAGAASSLSTSVGYGLPSWEDPAVAVLGTGRGICSAVLVGCRTALTAAHCVCPGLRADGCIDDPELTDPSRFTLFLQHAGFIGVRRVTVPPDFLFETGHDVAVLELAAPVSGIRPLEVGTLPGAPDSTPGRELFFVGFGEGDGAGESIGIKRFGRNETVACTEVPEETHVCVESTEPPGAPGEDSTTCHGDSGGPLLAGPRSVPIVVGIASGAETLTCRAPNRSWFTELAADLEWLGEAAGPDLGSTGCSDLPVVGAPSVAVLRGDGRLDAELPVEDFTFEVPEGTRELRVSVNGEVGRGNADLYLRAGAPASASAFDCAGERPTPFEHCAVPSPQAGTWHVRVARAAGSLRFQVTATLFGAEPPETDPPPPAGEWLETPALDGFRVQATITPAGGPSVPAAQASPCIRETLCLSGLLPDRPEAFVKVIGPRPNGFLWVQISRFTPSAIEIWVEQTATGLVRYYRLEPVGPGDPDVSGRQDRQAFPP